MSFKRSYSVESHERIKQILIFGDKSLLLTWWVTYKFLNYYLELDLCSGSCQMKWKFPRRIRRFAATLEMLMKMSECLHYKKSDYWRVLHPLSYVSMN